MDNIYFILGGRHGYTPTLYGIYNNELLAKNRINELESMEDYYDFHCEIKEFILNSPIEYEF